MLQRMFEYDTQIALSNSKISEDSLEVSMPKAVVIYLRSTGNTPDNMKITIQTSNEKITYNIPVLKVKNYSINEIFKKKLLFFIPFHIFVYENKFKEYNKTKEGVKELQQNYADICERLKKLVITGEIDEYTRYCLMDMTKKVVNHIAAKYENIRKGIGEVMGGRVLDYEAKDIYNAGRSEGLFQGAWDVCLSMVKDGIISLAEAAKRLGMTEEEIKERL